MQNGLHVSFAFATPPPLKGGGCVAKVQMQKFSHPLLQILQKLQMPKITPLLRSLPTPAFCYHFPMPKQLPNLNTSVAQILPSVSPDGEGDLAKAGESRALIFAALDDRLAGKHWRDIMAARNLNWLTISIARHRSKTLNALISAVDAAVNQARVERILDAQAAAAEGIGDRPPDPRAAQIVLAGLDKERFGADKSTGHAPSVVINIGGGIAPAQIKASAVDAAEK